MGEQIDKETEAIKAVLLALEPLSPEVRTSVLEYVLKRLQITLGPVQPTEVSTPASSANATPATVKAGTERQTTPTQIKDFKEKKKPRGD